MSRHAHRSGNTPPKDPVYKPWIWITIAIIVAISVPWYWTPGSLQPIVFGLPLWAWVTAIGSVVLCAFLSWACLTQWETSEDDMDQDKES